MRHVKQTLFLAGAWAVMMMISCSDDPNDPDQNPNPNPNNPSGQVTITGVSNDEFWGEELVINGTGFSAVKEENIVKFTGVSPTPTFCNLNYTSVAGDIEIVSASETQLKIKIPVRRDILGDPSCGPESANVEVTVKEKTAKFEGLKFYGLPYVVNFNYHYNWFAVPDVTRIGDSVMLNAGMLGTSPQTSKYWDALTLNVNGTYMPHKFRNIGGVSGLAFYLPVADYAEMNCEQEPDGWGARKMSFRVYIQGTTQEATKELYVQYLPAMSASCDLCPATFSKFESNPMWKISGQNMNFTEVRFVPKNCGGPSQGMALNMTPWSDKLDFVVPISMLADGCTYTVLLSNACMSELIGEITIAG
jgi:hypothetical protein